MLALRGPALAALRSPPFMQDLPLPRAANPTAIRERSAMFYPQEFDVIVVGGGHAGGVAVGHLGGALLRQALVRISGPASGNTQGTLP